MRETKATLKKTRKELGISYHTYYLKELNIKNIKKVVSKNEDYQLSKKEILDEEYEVLYQYYEEFDEIEVKEDEVYIQGELIGKVSKKVSKQIKDHIYECIIYGGNIKRITLKDEDPIDVSLTKSNLFYGRIEIRDH